MRSEGQEAGLRLRKETVLLLAILAAALALRLIPIASDMPYFSSLDEVDYIETALRFGTGTFKLASYMHGVLYQLILFLEYAVYFALGRALGHFGSATDFLLAYLKDPSPFFLVGRMTSVLCGVGAVWLCHAIASRAYDARVGLAAGVFTAFSLLMFQTSFLALADLPSVFLLMLAVYLMVLSVEQPRERRRYGCAAALVGLAAACKYHAVFGVVTLLVAAFLKARADRRPAVSFLRLAALGGVLAFAGFCAGAPQLPVDPGAFYTDVFNKLGGQYIGRNPLKSGWLFLFTHHLRNCLGIPLEAASLLGLGYALYKRSKWDLLMLSFPLSFYLVFMHAAFAYHLLPAAAFLLILAARLVDAAAQKLPGGRGLWPTLLLAAAIVTPTSLDCLRLLAVLRSPDTRMTAKVWIETHIPAGAAIMAEGYSFTVPVFGPPLMESAASVERDIAIVKESRGTGRIAALRLAHYRELYGDAKAYDVFKFRFLDSNAIAARRPRYLVMSSAKDKPSGDELRGMYMTEEFGPKRTAVKEQIRRGYSILASIAPTAAFTNFFPHLMDEDYRQIRGWPLFSEGRSRGPTITIWERRPNLVRSGKS